MQGESKGKRKRSFQFNFAEPQLILCKDTTAKVPLSIAYIVLFCFFYLIFRRLKCFEV